MTGSSVFNQALHSMKRFQAFTAGLVLALLSSFSVVAQHAEHTSGSGGSSMMKVM